MTNKYSFLFILMGFLLVNVSIYSGAEIPMGGGKFQSIRVEYTITGKYQTGKQIFLQKGNKTLCETQIDTKILSKSYSEHTLEIDDGQTFYRINLINKSGLKIPSLNLLKKQMVENNPQLFKSGQINPLSIIPPKGLLKKKETVLGKSCDIYLYNNKMIYIWENIILQETSDIIEKSVKIAQKLEVDIPLEDSSFDIPKDIHFQSKKEMEQPVK